MFLLSESFPAGSDGKESACNVGDLDLIPGLGRSPAEGNGYPLSILAREISWTEFEQALGAGDEQGSLACCSPH